MIEVKFNFNEVSNIVRTMGEASGALEAIRMTADLTETQRSGIARILALIDDTQDMISASLETPKAFTANNLP